MITFELGIDGLLLEMRMFDYVLNVCAFYWWSNSTKGLYKWSWGTPFRWVLGNKPVLLTILQLRDSVTKFRKVVGEVLIVTSTWPQLDGLPHLETFTWQIWPQLTGLPYLADQATRQSGYPTYLSCKRDQDVIKYNTDRRITPL